MPLIKSKSGKAVSENIKTEMASGTPHKQAIAIALSVQRRAKKPHKMAEGGKAYSPKAEKFIERRMHTFGKEGMHSRTKEGPVVHDPKQAIAIAMSESRKKGMKVPPEQMADGGEVDDTSKMTIGERIGYPGAKTRQDIEKEEHEDHEESIADEILEKRKRYAEGGQVDLDENAHESENVEDDLSFGALRKELYPEEEALEAVESPEDSNEHGRILSDEDEHDAVEAIRHKMRMKARLQ